MSSLPVHEAGQAISAATDLADVELEQALAYDAFETDDEGAAGRQPSPARLAQRSPDMKVAGFTLSMPCCGFGRRASCAVALAVILSLAMICAGLLLARQMGPDDGSGGGGGGLFFGGGARHGVTQSALVPKSTLASANHDEEKMDTPRHGKSSGKDVSKTVILHPGDGKTFPMRGEFLFLHYTGMLPDGTVFDSSRKRFRPYSFRFVEDAPIIRGWREGLKLMTLGERAILHVPSALAYGRRGRGKVPPNSDLDFDVQILAVGSHVWDYLNISAVASPGDGKHFPHVGDTVYVHFILTLAASGKEIDSTRSRGKPLRFGVGFEQVDYGMDFGIQKFSLGERATLNVPNQLAYGEIGAGPIPPNADLRFDMELLALERRRMDCFDECPPPLPAAPATVPAGALKPL